MLPCDPLNFDQLLLFTLGCRTGAKVCSDACYFIGEDGEPVSSMVVTNTSLTTTINTIALGICQMSILVVGGGGAGANGGGGSGTLLLFFCSKFLGTRKFFNCVVRFHVEHR